MNLLYSLPFFLPSSHPLLLYNFRIFKKYFTSCKRLTLLKHWTSSLTFSVLQLLISHPTTSSILFYFISFNSVWVLFCQFNFVTNGMLLLCDSVKAIDKFYFAFSMNIKYVTCYECYNSMKRKNLYIEVMSSLDEVMVKLFNTTRTLTVFDIVPGENQHFRTHTSINRNKKFMLLLLPAVVWCPTFFSEILNKPFFIIIFLFPPS
jgi:hypothetical protein